MASIRERTSKRTGVTTYQVAYRFEGAQRADTFDTEKSAKQFCAFLNAGGHPDQAPGRVVGADPQTVAEWVKRYIDHLTVPNPETIGDYRRHLRHDIEPFPIAHLRLVDLTREHVAKWVQTMQETRDLRGKMPSEKTIINKHGFLSAALNMAVLDGHIPRNPARGVAPARTFDEDDEPATEMIALTHAEFEILLAGMPDHYKPFIRFLVETGCRVNEATALTPADIDRNRCEVRINKTYRRGDSSGLGYYVGPTKTKNSKRWVSVRASLLDTIEYGPNDERVFKSGKGDFIRIGNFRNNVWAKRMRKVNLPEHRKPRIHDLRHTHASWLIDANWNAYKIMRRLGHADIRTTYNTYGHLMDVDRDAEQILLDKALT